ncbi:cystatin-8 [Mustela erminea]|uniref:Cystatin-8 n=2 Tax=Mustela TaxID=9665 RepID=M3XPY2_MUSPF|nr:cystatin-8 [Mustela putorius furo]XP_004754158.1 cystatin-8 [Mustela putorius furo]XP_004754159.1 cystatin-8 [Mustela putorius furo]XP_032209650.1 cystatin-8 [Mustela erminea]XP_032209651.1 cystatin-8 [Mustela erminea]XP_032209653.1 cystatin-8 [Mustela erminea]
MGERGSLFVSWDGRSMTRSWGTCLLLLTILVALVSSTDPGKKKVKVLRELKLINASNANVKQCLWFAMQEYNKESEDKYLFQVVKTVQVQLQVTDRLEYFIDVVIGRSNCRKFSNSTENCSIQENSKLEKKVMCSFLVGALPWNGEFMVMKKQCADA